MRGTVLGGYRFGGPNNKKDNSIRGFILGSPYLGETSIYYEALLLSVVW